MTTHVDGSEYDVVFAGGGTAACVAAGRLALADPSLSILLIEGGRNNLNDPSVTTPAVYLSHLAPNSQTALFYKSQASKELLGREAIVPCGGILGGGSSINFMMYTRAQAVDYDNWNLEGWDFKSVLPSFKRFETYHLKNPEIDYDVHGESGPVNVSRGTWAAKGPEDDLIAAGEAMGLPEAVDEQDFRTINAQSRWARYVSPEGVRQDAAHRYIHPLLASGHYPNLHLLLNTKVSRVLLDDNLRATGVEVIPTPSAQPITNLSKPLPSTITARKLVLVSAGALGTPSILERSGIGAKDILSKAGVDCVVDLPGVGENYQDHNLIMYPYKTSLQPDETLDGILSGRLDIAKATIEKNPILGWNGIDIAAKLRPTDAEVEALGEDFKRKWDRDFAPYPERPLMLIGAVSTFLGDHSILPPEAGQQFISMGTYTAYPYSRGSIHITSSSPLVPAEFHAGFLRDDADVKALVWAYKKQREIYRRTNAYRGELEMGHPVFPKGSNATLANGSLKADGFKSIEERKAVADIEYSQEDDAAIERLVRQNVETTWHSIGTCRMGKREEGGVLGPRLDVHGTKGLKVVDLSICPENVAANTNNTALMVGERAAELIIQDLGLAHPESEKPYATNAVHPKENGFIQASL